MITFLGSAVHMALCQALQGKHRVVPRKEAIQSPLKGPCLLSSAFLGACAGVLGGPM
jgi:hypothetical protein